MPSPCPCCGAWCSSVSRPPESWRADLFQNGRRDSNVADAERYHQVATEPKTIKWYDAGHDLKSLLKMRFRRPRWQLLPA